MKDNENNILKYRKHSKLNIATIIFALFVVYIMVYLIVYINRDKISTYKVEYGQNISDTTSNYKGLIIRDEYVTYSNQPGYVNYFVQNLDRVSLKTSVYVIDQSGKLSQMISEQIQESTLFENVDLSSLRNEISDFSNNFNSISFSDIYEFKDSINNQILEIVTHNALDTINKQTQTDTQANKLVTNPATKSGVIALFTDGYEALKEDEITKDIFDKSVKNVLCSSNTLIASGKALYKIINNEKWSIYIPIENEDVAKYSSKTSLNIDLGSLYDNITAQSQVLAIQGNNYIKLTLDKYMIEFIDERFIDVAIRNDTIKGLKIPASAVVEKEFYTVPVTYFTNGGNSNNLGIYLQNYDSQGESKVVFTPLTIYKKTDELYYIDKSDLSPGDQIIKTDSTQVFTVASIDTLKGVYCINGGYTEFRQIDILTKTGDYYLVSDKSDYGISIYDYIALDGSLVNENEVVFQ